MAGTTSANVVIRQDEAYSGIIEVILQNSDFVNETTRGAIQYVTQSSKGEFQKRSFWELGDDMVFDRDPSATGPVASTGFSQEDIVSPKMNLRLGPKKTTEDQWYKLEEDPENMSFIFGVQLGKNLATQWLNRALTAGVACLTQPNFVYDVSDEADEEQAVISTRVINKALGKIMGDNREKVRALVMHSAAFTDLTDGQIVDKLTGVTDRIVYGGSTATMGYPVLVTDSPALIDESEGTYTILALTENALVMTEAEGPTRIRGMEILGNENIQRIIQGETAVLVGVKGFSFSGNASPDVAAIGNAVNWDYVMSDVKAGAGLAIVTAIAGHGES